MGWKYNKKDIVFEKDETEEERRDRLYREWWDKIKNIKIGDYVTVITGHGVTDTGIVKKVTKTKFTIEGISSYGVKFIQTIEKKTADKVVLVEER